VAFTAADLAHAAKFEATERSKPEDIAAGWISKLVRWGYLRRAASPERDNERRAGRPVQWYELTAWGKMKEKPKASWKKKYPPRQGGA